MSQTMAMLVWRVILGPLQMGLAVTFSIAERGLGWAVGPRDRMPPWAVALVGMLRLPGVLL